MPIEHKKNPAGVPNTPSSRPSDAPMKRLHFVRPGTFGTYASADFCSLYSRFSPLLQEKKCSLKLYAPMLNFLFYIIVKRKIPQDMPRRNAKKCIFPLCRDLTTSPYNARVCRKCICPCRQHVDRHEGSRPQGRFPYTRNSRSCTLSGDVYHGKEKSGLG